MRSGGCVCVCVEYSILKDASLRDSFPLPIIDQIMDTMIKHKLMSFLDAYSRYNQIPKLPEDVEKITFTTPMYTCCYNIMPFDLKNARQRIKE